MLLNDPNCIYFIFLDDCVEKRWYMSQKGHKYVSQIVFTLGFQTPYLLPAPLMPSDPLGPTALNHQTNF